MNKYIYPQWTVPTPVESVSTTRLGGAGKVPFDSFNLGTHVGDDPVVVQQNRELLTQELSLPATPRWLNQVHGEEVIYVADTDGEMPTADAAWTDVPGCVLSVMTADCLPLLLTSKTGDCVAAVHGGWRGLLAGVVQNTVATLPASGNQLQAWLGPAIGPSAFEVGAEVREKFVEKSADFEKCFRVGDVKGKFIADIYAIGRLCLRHAGVHDVQGGNYCTFQDQTLFFSYRRDGGTTGRMASLIWIERLPRITMNNVG